MKKMLKQIGALLIMLMVLAGLIGCTPKIPAFSSIMEQSSAALSSEAESGTQDSSQDESSLAQSSQESSPEESSTAEESSEGLTVTEDGKYYSKDEVALYIHLYKHLPSNYLTKKEAQNLGWVASKGNLWKVTDKMVIGGDRFGNYEELLPTKKGRYYTECDVNYNGGTRDAQRIVFSNDGLIYYTKDHYQSFELLYE